MVSTIRAITCVSLLTLSACGGGGGGGGSSPASPPPPLIPPGTFLAAPGANCTGSACTGPESSVSFTNPGVFGSGTSSATGAQVTIATDATGKASTVTINVPAPGGGFYTHPFDLTTTGVAGTGPFAGFISAFDGVNADGSRRNQILLDPNLTYSSYGLWTNIPTSAAAGATGALAFGQLTPASNVPINGTFSYSGKTIGAMVDGTKSTPLIGSETLTANFTNMNLTGSFSLSTVAASGATTPWTTLNISPAANIMSGAYTGTVTGSISSGTVSGPINGKFYGPTAQETAGTWSVSDGANIHAIGGYGAKR